MVGVIPAIGALLLGVFMLLLGSGLLGTLLGVRAVIEAFSTPMIGIVMAGFYAGLMLGSIYCRPIIQRVGHIRAFAAFVSIISASPLLHGFAVDPLTWFVLRAITGFCFAGVYTVTESWLNARASNQTRGRIFSFYMITTFLALGGGQLLLTVEDPTQLASFAVVAVLVSLAVVPVALTRSAAPEIHETARLDLPQLILNSPLGVAGTFIAGLVGGAIYGMVPVFGQGVGLSIEEISILMSSLIIGGLIIQWPIGRMSDILDRRVVIAASSTAAALVSLFVFFWSDMPRGGLFTATAFFGGLVFSQYSLAVAHTNDMTDSARLVETSAGLVLIYGAGAALGPLAGAGAMAVGGEWSLFIFFALAMAVLGAFGFYRMTVRAAPPIEEQAPYVAMPRTTPEALYMDPRAEEFDDEGLEIADGAPEQPEEEAARPEE